MARRIFQSLGDQVFENIKEKIINNEYPPGYVLQIDKLANELGVSTTPIRETLLRLETLKLVKINRNKGAVVSNISKIQVSDVIEFRKILESYGARSAARNLSDAEINDLENIMLDVLQNPSDFENYKLSDMKFHSVIASRIENNLIRESIVNLGEHSRRIRYYAENTPFKENIIKKVTKEHLNIIEALKKRDPDLVEKAVAQHLDNAKKRTLDALEKQEKKD